jgi:hypothetical protein
MSLKSSEEVQIADTANIEKKNKELTPEEVVEHLSKLKKRYCVEFGEKTGAEIIFPKNTMVGDVDVSGQSFETVLDMFISKLDNYEPPVVQKQFEDDALSVETETDLSLPIWLKGHEELVWKGAHDNPFWEVKADQHKNDVTISYERRGQTLQPGRDVEEQGRELESLKNTFTLDEWKVVKKVLDQYISLEKDMGGQDEEAKKIAKAEIFSILKEENEEVIGVRTKQIDEYEKLLDEECIAELYKIKQENLPQDIQTQDMRIIFNLIEE